MSSSDLEAAQKERWRTRIEQALNAHARHISSAREEFFAAVLDDLETRTDGVEVSDGVVERTVMRHYCAQLWRACGSDDSAEQKEALTEVWNYLRPRALYRVGDASLADELAQQALERVWEKRAACRDPGAFLGWADQVLLNLIRDHYRKHSRPRSTRDGILYERREVEADAAEADENAGWDTIERTDDGVFPDPFESAAQFSMRREVLAALRDCLRNERYVKVITERYLNSKNLAQVGAAVGVTPLNTQVMTSRAMAKLRDCPEMKRVYFQWLN